MPRSVPLWFVVFACVASWFTGYLARDRKPQPPQPPAVVRYVPQPLPAGFVVYDETNGTRDANKLLSVGYTITDPQGYAIDRFDD